MSSRPARSRPSLGCAIAMTTFLRSHRAQDTGIGADSRDGTSSRRHPGRGGEYPGAKGGTDFGEHLLQYGIEGVTVFDDRRHPEVGEVGLEAAIDGPVGIYQSGELRPQEIPSETAELPLIQLDASRGAVARRGAAGVNAVGVGDPETVELA